MGAVSYSTALALHVLGAFLFFAGMVVAGAFHLAALRREEPREVAALLRLTRVGVVAVAFGFALVLVFGFWLVDLAGYALGDGWIVGSLVLLGLASGLGSAGGRPLREARERAEAGEDVRAELRAPWALFTNYAAAAAAIGVLALMIFKPGA